MLRFTDWIESLLDYVFTSFFVVLAAFLVLAEWRKQPTLAIASLLVGPILGAAAGRMWGADLGVFVTFFATIAAPGLILIANDKTILARLAERLLKRVGKDGEG